MNVANSWTNQEERERMLAQYRGNEDFIGCLDQLKQQALNGYVEYPMMGICRNLRCIVVRHNEKPAARLIDSIDVYGFVSFGAMDWEHSAYPGIPAGCPVPPPKTQGREVYWKGKQLELRISLIDHLIKLLKT